MLQVNQLSFSYGRNIPPVIENFSMHLEEGKIYGLLGKNGVGKSTLLYLLMGMLRPSQGTVLFEGVDVGRHRPSVLENMFILSEEFVLPNVKFSTFVKRNRVFYPRFSDELLSSLLNEFGLPADFNLSELSMGQKKKVYVSFALAANTRLLLMDEPSNGLDIPSKVEFRRAVSKSMSDERSIVISTHQVRDVESLLDHILIMNHRELMLDASVAELCSKLLFKEQGLNESLEGSIYYQPSVSGNSALYPNRDGEESNLNIEVLFNAALANSETIHSILKK